MSRLHAYTHTSHTLSYARGNSFLIAPITPESAFVGDQITFLSFVGPKAGPFRNLIASASG